MTSGNEPKPSPLTFTIEQLERELAIVEERGRRRLASASDTSRGERGPLGVLPITDARRL